MLAFRSADLYAQASDDRYVVFIEYKKKVLIVAAFLNYNIIVNNDNELQNGAVIACFTHENVKLNGVDDGRSQFIAASWDKMNEAIGEKRREI